MKDFKPEQGKLWKHISQTQITKDKVQDLTHFKSSAVNFKISLWNPKINGIRYLKTLIYNVAASLTPEDWEKISKIKNRSLGDPITITYSGEKICLDYLQALFELEFIEEYIQVDGLSILEIGAGYGRTCHAIMSNYKVKTYSIVDLENCLELSHRYLRRVLDQSNFSKINFVGVKDIDFLLGDSFFDLCINIDSFAEMDPESIKYYLRYINQNCNYLYVKNPVGKYLDKSLDDHTQGEDVVKLALNTGVLRDIIDIHNNAKVEAQVSKFIEAYQPGEKWKCIADSWARPWSYYWQAIYKKIKNDGR